VLELFPDLGGGVEAWRWDETEAGEPFVLIDMHASFTGLESGDLLLCCPIPNTGKVGVYRIDTGNRYALVRLEDDPFASEQAKLN
jgi:hypothetical protein